MIDDTIICFPDNVSTLIAARMQLLDTSGDLTVLKRPLRNSDPILSIGVFGSMWLPTEDSYEMKGGAPSRHEPSLSSYLITIQAFVKDADEARGLMRHSLLAKMIRSTLYGDEPLRVALRSLSVSMNGSTERTQRFGIRTQRYLGNELRGSWLYLSTIEFWLETETI